MKRFRWALALLQGAMLVLAMCLATPAYAADLSANDATSLNSAVSSADDGNTITLGSDITLTQTLTIGATKNITLDLNGKTITCAYGNAADQNKRIEVATNGSLTIISSVATGKILNSVTLPNNTAPGHEPGLSIIKNQGTLTLQGNTSIESDDTCVYAASGTLTIEDGTKIISKYGNAVATNGNNDNNTTVSILGGEMTSTYAVAVYAPSGTFNISGGTIIGATGVYMKGGKLDITGGNITGNGSHVDYTPYNNGGVPTGDALVVDVCGYPQGANPEISITDGSFSSTEEGTSPIGSYASSNYTRKTGFVSGGTFNRGLESNLLATDSGLEQSGGAFTVTHVHSFDKEGNTQDPSYWTWRRINGVWSATSTYKCTSCDATLDVPATVTVPENSNTQTSLTINATDTREKLGSWTWSQLNNVTLPNGASANPSNPYWWGDVVTANNTTGTPWFVNTELLGNTAVQFASSRTSFTFPVTENSTTITNTGTSTGTEPFIYATLKDGDTSTKTFNVKWSLPADAVVLSAIVYRGHTTDSSAAVTMDNLIAKGSKRDTGLHVRVGDYTMNLTSLTPSNTQHIAIRIVYVTNGVENTLNCGVNVSGVESSYSGTPAQTNSDPKPEP